MFFLIDEQTDKEPVDVVVERCEMVMDAVLHPQKPRPRGECIIGEATRQWVFLHFIVLTDKLTSICRCWARASTELPQVIIERFERTWKKYLDSVVRQAQNRDRKRIIDPEEYLRERVDNIGIPPSVAIGEQTMKLDIPHECIDHPYMETMVIACSECVTLQNVSRFLKCLRSGSCANARTTC